VNLSCRVVAPTSPGYLTWAGRLQMAAHRLAALCSPPHALVRVHPVL